MKKAFLFLLLLSIFVLVGCEREGLVNTDDCREIVNIKENSLKKYYKAFTCAYERSYEGDIILGGHCINIDTGFWGNKCKRAYIYERKPDLQCPNTENGYLIIGGECVCKSGYVFNEQINKCVKPDYRIAYYEYLGVGKGRITEVDQDGEIIKIIDDPSVVIDSQEFLLSWNTSREAINAFCPEGYDKIVDCVLEDQNYIFYAAEGNTIDTEKSWKGTQLLHNHETFCQLYGEPLTYGKMKLTCSK